MHWTRSLIPVLVALLAWPSFGSAQPPRRTYIITATNLFPIPAATVYRMKIENAATGELWLHRFCISHPDSANARVLVTFQRATGVSTSGTQATNEGSGPVAVSKADPADPNFPGIARCDRCNNVGAAVGTAGAILDSFAWTSREGPGAGVDSPDMPPVCRTYSPPIVVPPGTDQGLLISVANNPTTDAVLSIIVSTE